MRGQKSGQTLDVDETVFVYSSVTTARTTDRP